MGDTTDPADRVYDAGGKGPQDSADQAEAIITVRFEPSRHNGEDFRCARSRRVQEFFSRDGPQFLSRNYCRVFVLPSETDPTRIRAFYTLSPGLVQITDVSKTQQRRLLSGLPVPMARIGFLGRDDREPKELGLGRVMLLDAALRVQRCEDMTAWGLYLDAETEDVAKWYEKCRFMRTVSKRLVMYASLRTVLGSGGFST